MITGPGSPAREGRAELPKQLCFSAAKYSRRLCLDDDADYFTKLLYRPILIGITGAGRGPIRFVIFKRHLNGVDKRIVTKIQRWLRWLIGLGLYCCQCHRRFRYVLSCFTVNAQATKQHHLSGGEERGW